MSQDQSYKVWQKAEVSQGFYAFHQDKEHQKSREEIDQQYYSRADKKANILTLVETQCEWLRNICFVDVDCFMKIFELGLFGGIRPN
jgi:hypothetical protein